ncbi:hypothetical protein [Propionibacterium australiense]|nr:hypothetical protein [Propionibacterium australiense]
MRQISSECDAGVGVYRDDVPEWGDFVDEPEKITWATTLLPMTGELSDRQ